MSILYTQVVAVIGITWKQTNFYFPKAEKI